MPPVNLLSLRHEYDRYFEREVEAYKNSVSRTHLCAIADEASAVLAQSLQLGIDDLLLAAEVDQHIARRLSIPSFDRWQRRRLRNADKPTRPECWGIRPDTPLTLALPATSATARVLVNGANAEGATLYLASNGCEVTTVESEPEVVERLLVAAMEAGVAHRVRGLSAELCEFRPEGLLSAVICTPAAFAAYADFERGDAVASLQDATEVGGVHVVETLVPGQAALSDDELRSHYREWSVTFQPAPGATRTFVARKPPSLRAGRAQPGNRQHR